MKVEAWLACDSPPSEFGTLRALLVEAQTTALCRAEASVLPFVSEVTMKPISVQIQLALGSTRSLLRVVLSRAAGRGDAESTV